jgi:hypothetical protein
MELGEMLKAVTNERIEFVTRQASPSASERRVVITGPREVLELTAYGDAQALGGLIELLRDPDRAWGAEVALAALTRNEEEVVNAFAARPRDWEQSLGPTAHDRWSKWFAERGRNLRWNSQEKVFVEGGK